jgi:hypothetical protein
MPAPDLIQVFEVVKAAPAGEATSDEVIAELGKRGTPGLMTWCYSPMMREWWGMGFLSKRDASGSDPGRKRGTPVYRVTPKGEEHLKATRELRAQLAKAAAEKKPAPPDFED